MESEIWLHMPAVIAGPLADIAVRFSRLIMPLCPHVALIIFTRECTGRPRKVAGRIDLVGRVTVTELDTLRDNVSEACAFDGTVTLGGSVHRVWAMRHLDTLLVLVPRSDESSAPDETLMRGAFGVVATAIRLQVVQASPDYLAESRAASSERSRTITELTVAHEATLTSLLGTLRSAELDDGRARLIASETASVGLLALRKAGAADRALSEEPVSAAFIRLRQEVGPLLRDRDVEVEYVEPPTDGRPLPGEVANAARAVVRAIVMAVQGQRDVRRVRITWDCDGENLLIEVRDQGAGVIDQQSLKLQLAGRLHTLRGVVDIESVAGWGNRVVVSMPLGPREVRPDEHLLGVLNARELEVLGHLAAGRRNKAIGDELGISVSTVKFHVAAVLRKLGVGNRGEAAAMATRAGLAAL